MEYYEWINHSLVELRQRDYSISDRYEGDDQIGLE